VELSALDESTMASLRGMLRWGLSNGCGVVETDAVWWARIGWRHCLASSWCRRQAYQGL
jgi:hypothetical protein